MKNFHKTISDISLSVVFYCFIYECINKMLFAKWQNSFTQTLTNIYLTNEIARPIRRTFSEWEMPRFNELYLISKMYKYNHTRTNEIIGLTRYDSYLRFDFGISKNSIYNKEIVSNFPFYWLWSESNWIWKSCKSCYMLYRFLFAVFLFNNGDLQRSHS